VGNDDGEALGCDDGLDDGAGVGRADGLGVGIGVGRVVEVQFLSDTEPGSESLASEGHCLHATELPSLYQPLLQVVQPYVPPTCSQ